MRMFQASWEEEPALRLKSMGSLSSPSLNVVASLTRMTS